LIRERGLTENIKYLGPLYGIEKYKKMNQSDVLVYPTLNDAFPLVILEAMQVQLPIIASKIGAIPEILEHNDSGLLIEPKSPEEIYKYLYLLYKDIDLRKKLSRKAFKKFIENYTYEVFQKNMLRTLNTILENQ